MFSLAVLGDIGKTPKSEYIAAENTMEAPKSERWQLTASSGARAKKAIGAS
jgi:hypothetical protein